MILIGRTDVHLQALLSGEIHFGTLNADSVIAVAEKGAILKVIAGVDNAAPYFLIGGKNYKKVEDLKGARLGVSSLRGGATSILLEYLKTKGLFFPRDFILTVISGGTVSRLTALETGAIAGAVLGFPYSDIAVDQGFTRFYFANEDGDIFGARRPGRTREIAKNEMKEVIMSTPAVWTGSSSCGRWGTSSGWSEVASRWATACWSELSQAEPSRL